LLDDLVFECRYTNGSLLPVGLEYPNPLARLDLVALTLHSIMEIGKALFEFLAVLLPCYTVYSGYRLAIECLIGFPQQIDGYVVLIAT